MKALITDLVSDIAEQVRFLRELGVDSIDASIAQLPQVIAAEALVSGTSASKEERSAASPMPVSMIPENIAAAKPVVERPKIVPGQRLASLPSLVDLSKDLKKDMPNSKKAAKQNAENSGQVSAVITNEPSNDGIRSDKGSETLSPMPEPVETIQEIRDEIGPNCTRCKLCELGRSQVVNSVGNFDARLMFVGEAPGADEDEQGEPFVGRAGQLLTKIMESIGFDRKDVFIGNINRCRPPKNRAPEPDETAQCKPFLLREIAVVRPEVIVVLGATAAHNLLETKVPIGKLRGHFHDYMGVKVMPTFHPAYLLRDPHKKREVWDDMKMVRDLLAENKAGNQR